ncbi:hypothetical protein AAVH_06600 [Aphelenchoides avenae]|nr:hypothetical protein AAVH_06600 [Aphelenchus avenae]
MEHQPSRQYNRGISSAQLELIQLNRQLENENRMLKFSLRKYDKSLRETEAEASSTQKWISELRTEISKTTATLSESETELHAKQTEKEGLRQELNEMKSQVAALEERLSQVDEPPEVDPEIGAIEKQIENLQSQVEEQKSRKRTTETLLEERRAELETQKKSLEWKETELKAAVEIATFLQQKMDEMDRESRLSAASSVSPSAPAAGLSVTLPVALNGVLSQCNDSMEVGEDGADETKEYHRVGWSYSSDAKTKSPGILNLNRPFIRRPTTRFSDTAHQRVSVNARVPRQGGCNIAGSTSSTPTKRKHPPIVWDETELSKKAPSKRHLAQVGTSNEPCDSGSMSSVTVRDSGDVTTSSTVTRKRTEHPPIVWRDTDDKKHGAIRLAMSGGAISTGTSDKKITTNSRASTNGSSTDDAEASMKKVGTAAMSDDDIARPAVVQAGCTSSTPAQRKHPPIIWDEAGPSRNMPVQSPAAVNLAASIVPRKHPAITCNPSSSSKDTAGVIDMPKRMNTAKSSLESIRSLIVDETELPSASPALKDPLLIRDNNTVPMKETLDRAANAKSKFAHFR